MKQTGSKHEKGIEILKFFGEWRSEDGGEVASLPISFGHKTTQVYNDVIVSREKLNLAFNRLPILFLCKSVSSDGHRYL